MNKKLSANIQQKDETTKQPRLFCSFFAPNNVML